MPEQKTWIPTEKFAEKNVGTSHGDFLRLDLLPDKDM